jgi:hypothetical protein
MLQRPSHPPINCPKDATLVTRKRLQDATNEIELSRQCEDRLNGESLQAN